MAGSAEEKQKQAAEEGQKKANGNGTMDGQSPKLEKGRRDEQGANQHQQKEKMAKEEFSLVDDVKKTKPSRSRLYCSGFSAFLGLLLVLGGVLVLLHFRDLVDALVRSRVPLRENSPVTANWLSPPVTPKLRVYFFHVRNPDGVLLGEKPLLSQKGPYVYSQKWRKANVTWLDGGNEVEYEQTKTYTFERDESVGGEDDVVTLPNLPFLVSRI